MNRYGPSKFERVGPLVEKIYQQYVGKSKMGGGGIAWAEVWKTRPEYVKEIFGTPIAPPRTGRDMGTFLSFARRHLRKKGINTARKSQAKLQPPTLVQPRGPYRKKRGSPGSSAFNQHRQLIEQMLAKYTKGGSMNWKLAFLAEPGLKDTLINPAAGKTQTRLYSFCNDRIYKKARGKGKDKSLLQEMVTASSQNGTATVDESVPAAVPAKEICFCPYCGRNVVGAMFCSNCGDDIGHLRTIIDIGNRYAKPSRR